MFLEEFKKNDEELDDIAGEIVKALDIVKKNAENIEAGIDLQSKHLAKQNARAEKINVELKRQGGTLKTVIQKHKSGR